MSNKHRNRDRAETTETNVEEATDEAVGVIDPIAPPDAASETLEAPSAALGPSLDSDLIPFSKAATLLGIHISVLNLWAKTRLISPVKVPGLGGGYMISRAALNKLLAASAFGKQLP